jgi:hypothetical protein
LYLGRDILCFSVFKKNAIEVPGLLTDELSEFVVTIARDVHFKKLLHYSYNVPVTFYDAVAYIAPFVSAPSADNI